MITTHAETLKKMPTVLYKILAQGWIDYKFPRHLFIETTAACNLKCGYCPREHIGNHMDFGIFKSVVDESSHFGARSFSLHLFGEPLLYPRFFEAVEYIKKCNERHTILLTTNGTLLERFIDRLTHSKLDKVIWSWRPEVKWSVQFKEKLKRWKAFTVRIIKETCPKEAFEEFITWPRVETRNLHNYGGEINLSNYGVKPTNGSRYPCYHLWYAPAVAWNGNLLICCADPHQKEVIGNVKTMTISRAWKKIQTIRDAHLKGQFTGICKDCDVWKNYPSIHFKWQGHR